MPEANELYERRLARESSARRQAEALLEQKSLDLYQEAQAREQAVHALRESEERYRLLVELSPEAILVESEGAIIYANPAAQLLFLAQRAVDLAGRNMLSLVAPGYRSAVAASVQGLTPGAFCPTSEEQAIRLDDTIVDVAVTRIAFTYREKPAIQIVLRDISDRKRLEAQLQYQASHDALTGLANRTLLRERLEQTIAYAARYGHSVWVLFLDLDRFKSVNDSRGHKAGDLFLHAIAARLRAAMRETDTVARLGGDEFVLILPSPLDETLATHTVRRVMDTVAQPMVIDGREFFLTCSIGVAIYPTDGADATTLIEHADIAMYRAKEVGRNNFQFFTASMNERLRERMSLESDLRKALERQEFLLHYQPQVDMRSGRVIGVEALIRWRHPRLGMVPPARFIGMAEEIGLIVPIGNWVLRTACAQAKAWQQAGLGNLRVAVNLSARQFAQLDLVRSIEDALAETGLAPLYLEIELTESLVMANVEHAVGVLRDLKTLGVKISIDDFGTGYSSLSYLKRFPIDVLKIDQSFVRDIAIDPDDAAIVLSIISLAHSLRLTVIAEGVETEAQLAYLSRHGCDIMQGYYFSRALPSDEFTELQQQRKSLQIGLDSAAVGQQTLLIVDDEAGTVAALEQLLQQDGYRIVTAQSAADGFELLALNRVQVILCDQRMPEMNGSEFLAKVKQLYPDTIRIMLSGHVEFRYVIDAINHGAIYRFFTKPWEDDLLRDSIRDAFRHYWLVQSTVHAQLGDATVE